YRSSARFAARLSAAASAHLNPSPGRIPTAGDAPIGTQLAVVDGPVARRVADLRAAFEVPTVDLAGAAPCRVSGLVELLGCDRTGAVELRVRGPGGAAVLRGGVAVVQLAGGGRAGGLRVVVEGDDEVGVAAGGGPIDGQAGDEVVDAAADRVEW